MEMIRVRKQAQHNALVALCCILLIYFFFDRAIWAARGSSACEKWECESSCKCKSRSIYCMCPPHSLNCKEVYFLHYSLFFLALCVSYRVRARILQDLTKIWPHLWPFGNKSLLSDMFLVCMLLVKGCLTLVMDPTSLLQQSLVNTVPHCKVVHWYWVL